MISAQPKLLKRYFSIARLLLRHGGSEWLHPDAQRELANDGYESDEADDSAQSSDLADDLAAMGPTFVKLGQLLSSRPDVVPQRHIEALRRLCDDVDPFDGAAARRIVRKELGVRVSKLFSSFDEQPFAAASLSQVHRARMRDGREVAVKVQRPGIRQTITDDLDALEQIADFLERHHEAARCLSLKGIVEQFRRTLMLELDFGNERANLVRFADMLAEYPLLQLPQPVDDYCTARVLTMEFIEGVDITALSPVVRTEIDGRELARALFDAFLHQVLVAGTFHADPHPGNLLLTPEHRVAVLDLGMVGRFQRSEQRRLLQLLMAVAECDGTSSARVAVSMGEKTERFDGPRFERSIAELVSRHDDLAMRDLNFGVIVVDICRTATACGLRLPSNLALLGKALLQLEEIGKLLDPDFDPHRAIRENAAALMEKRAASDKLPGQVYAALIQTRELAEKLPSQLGRILDNLAENDVRIKVDAFDQNMLVSSIRKIANRITAGIVLAALIVGAALLMRVETPFTLFGYPGLAIILFLAAASGGAWLAVSILLDDEGTNDRRRGRQS